MRNEQAEQEWARILGRMGEPSWLILKVLKPNADEALAGIQIIEEAEKFLAAAGYPVKTIDPATLHAALKRLQEDGLVCRHPERAVDVPGPHQTRRPRLRPVFSITPVGEEALAQKESLDTLLREARAQRWPAGQLRPAYE